MGSSNVGVTFAYAFELRHLGQQGACFEVSHVEVSDFKVSGQFRSRKSVGFPKCGEWVYSIYQNKFV